MSHAVVGAHGPTCTKRPCCAHRQALTTLCYAVPNRSVRASLGRLFYAKGRDLAAVAGKPRLRAVRLAEVCDGGSVPLHAARASIEPVRDRRAWHAWRVDMSFVDVENFPSRSAHQGEMSLPAALSRGSASGPAFLCTDRSLASLDTKKNIYEAVILQWTVSDKEVTNLDEQLGYVEHLALERYPGVAGRAVLSHLAHRRTYLSSSGETSEHLLRICSEKRKCARALDLSGRVVPRLDDHMVEERLFCIKRARVRNFRN